MSRNGIIVDRELSKHRKDGVNSMLLVEKIVRERVFDSLYWKQYCFNVNAASILDRCVELKCIGGQLSSGRPLPFLSLLVKLVQLSPEMDIIRFYVEQDRFKYLRCLGLLYVRLVYKDYKLIKKYYEDYRKVRIYKNDQFQLYHVDEFVDDLLNEKFVCGITLPYMSRPEYDDSDDDDNDSDDNDSDDHGENDSSDSS